MRQLLSSSSFPPPCWLASCCFFGTLAMVRLETGFKPRWFEQNLIQQTKNDVLQRLEGHHFGFLRIVLKKRNGRLAFQFFGDPGTVEKAKGLLGIC